ncbi:hypothetical protein [Thermococcus sp.]|uniref:hypothetical protein n=1 Tax=Thermococcus sp. TaxID=35749 RepID=UPI00260A146D|nr:hypothetical protein [Thermococcus sp.]
MYEVAYLPLALAGIRRKARPLAAGALLAFSLLYPLQEAWRYALLLISGAVFVLGWPFEKQPVKAWERFLNAVLAVVGIAITFTMGGSTSYLLGAAGIALFSGNRVLSSFGLLPVSALFLVSLTGLNGIAAFVLTYIYALHHLRKLLR